MAKRSSLFGAAPKPAAEEAPAVREIPAPAAPSRKHPVSPSREGKRAATAYIDLLALKQLKEIALDEETTVQDFLVKGSMLCLRSGAGGG